MTSEQETIKKAKWWKKPPRSSRICYRCEHKYSSHIDVRCLKIVSRKPRTECDCRGFIKDKEESDFMIRCKQAKRRTKNTFKRIMGFK
jgi:hypothetical protein